MSKSLITADLHFSDNPRDLYRHLWQWKLRSLVKKYQVDTVIVLGDITEEKDRHCAELVNDVVDHFHKLSALANVIILRGNHDAIDPDEPFFKFAGLLKNVYWINSPRDATTLPVEVRATLPSSSLFLPSTTDWEKDWSAIPFDKYKFVFAHNTFDGADAGRGISLRGVPTKMFTKGTRVFAGDIHIPQKLGCVTYVGAPYTVDFGDDYQPRVLIVEDSGKVTSVKVGGPQKRLVEIDWPTDFDIDHCNKGDILKVRVNIKKAQHAEWSEIKTKVREWGNAEGYQIHMVVPEVTDKAGPTAKRVKIKKRSDVEIIRSYSTAHNIDDRTMKIGLRMIGDA